MKLTHYIYISAALAILTACHHDDVVDNPVYTVGEEYNAIMLTAGKSEGNKTKTRSFDDTESRHTNHLLLSNGTQLTLEVAGSWTSHVPENVKRYTTGTIGAETATGSKHNAVSFTTTEKVYWDDFGTADPANTANRGVGLSVYAIAVDGETTAPSIGNDKWAGDYAWTLNASGTDVLKKDLLVSNNLKWSDAFKFDDFKKIVNNEEGQNKNAGLLEFRHMMSKITINLTAQDGFPTSGTGLIGTTEHKFEKAPIFELGTSTGTLQAYAIVKGIVDVENATATGGTADEDKAIVKAETLSTPAKTGATVSLHALVFPDTQFGTADDFIIGRLNADDNIYYITAAKIRAAILTKFGAEHVNDYKTMPGYNYILNIVVNKTAIQVSATVTDWVDVEAAPDQPEIKVSTVYSATGNVQPSEFNSFSFYRSQGAPFASPASENISSEYNPNQKTGDFYAAEAVATGTLGSSFWTFKNLDKSEAVHLYWPTHSAHYHMRGVWPETVTTTGDIWTSPRVTAVSSTDPTQIIRIKNVGYAKNTFPSDLLIGAPEFTDANRTCNNDDHTHVDQSQYGICATQGTVTLNFKYQMSQVEVQLKTSEAGQYDHVNLVNAEVEIVQAYTAGYVTLGTREVVPQTWGNYTLNTCISSDSANYRRCAIVPQPLSNTFGDDVLDVMFKITIKNSSDPTDTDTYFATVKNINVKTAGESTFHPITSWEQGKHYIYKLDIRKTEIKVTASLTDWIIEEASERVWL